MHFKHICKCKHGDNELPLFYSSGKIDIIKSNIELENFDYYDSRKHWNNIETF